MNTKLNNPPRKWKLLYWMVILLSSGLSSCQVLNRLEPEYWQENLISSSSSEGTYSINTDTILESLAQGKRDVFFQKSNIPETDANLPIREVQWSQGDYLQIAQALYEFVWRETWQDWKIKELFFRMDCEQADLGAQQFSVTLYKIVNLQDKESRLVRVVDVRPLVSSVNWTEYEKYPVRENWLSINLPLTDITAEAALKIAEKNGGAEARSAVGNACIIYEFLFTSSQADFWRIDYSADDSFDRVFLVDIDPLTGEIK